MAFGIEGTFEPNLLRILQVGVTGFALGMVIIAIHKTIKKYDLE